MNTLQDGDTFTRGGRRFRVTIAQDCDMGAPWDEHDGHGPVRAVHASYGLRGAGIKRPGERVLYWDGCTVYLYDWQAACKLARADGWNAEPYDAPGRVERAVLADFERLQGWARGDWWWTGVQVALLDADGEETDTRSLWGIESDCGDYLQTVAHELADEMLHPLRVHWRAALATRRRQRDLQRLAAVQAAVFA